MDDLLNKFKSLSIYKTIKLLELEELIPKLPEFELFPKVKICTLGREYVFFKKNFVKEKENESEHLIHYSSKDKKGLLAKISLSECEYLIQQEVKEGLNIFLVIEKILNDLFGKVKKLVSKECINLTKLIGKEKTAILLCELGSLKRLTEIPAKNLKGIGYVNNFIFQQPSYLTGVKKNLRKLCNEVSFAAKKDFYNFEYEKKKMKKEKLIKNENSIKKEKLIKKRGGKKVKKIRNKILINRLIKEELKNKKEELFSSTSSDSEI